MGVREKLGYLKTIVKYNVKIDMRYPLSYLSGILNLFFWLLSFSILVMMLGSGQSSAILGNLIIWGVVSYMVFSSLTSEVGFGLYRLQRRGTLEQIFLTPIPYWLLPLGLAAFSLITGMIFMVFTIIFLVILMDIPIIILNPMGGLIAFTLMFAMDYGIVLIYAGFSIRTKRSSWALVNALNIAFMLFCGVFYSFSQMPEWLLRISRLIPQSYAVDLLRTTIIGIPPELIPHPLRIGKWIIEPTTCEWIIVATISITTLAIGYIYLTKTINEAKKKGYLSTY